LIKTRIDLVSLSFSIDSDLLYKGAL
jgi:hypothetical protein